MDLDLKAMKIDRENSHVEAKSAQYALPKTIWETYSAFANTDGGQIVLGVSEDPETKELVITGIIDPETVKKQFWDTINNPQKVSCNILSSNDLNEVSLDNGTSVFIINIPRASLVLRPIYINNDIINGSFKRNHEGDYHMTKEDVSKMLRDASPYSYDQKVYEELPLSVLSDDTITKFRRYHDGHRENHPWSKLSTEQYLLMIGAAAFSESDSVAHPTMAGLLMFGEEPVITRFFPDYFLDYRENLDPGKVRWTDRVQSISGEWSGNVFDFYLLVNNKLVMDLKVPFKLRGMERIDNTPLHDAVREAFINCLSNADYFGRCGIVIRKNVDSIVYENPGSIRVGKEQMMRGGISDARNKTIMKMFNLLGYGEKAGSGIPMIIQATEECGLPAPEVSENIEFDRTLFTIYLKPKVNLENDGAPDNLKTGGSSIKPLPDGAEITGDNAETSANGAENAGDNAENAGDNAENAGDNAENARDNAENARDNAENARDNAKNARDNAENVRDNAENARDDAEIVRDNADTSKNNEKIVSIDKGKKTKKDYIYKTLITTGGADSKFLSEATGLSLRRVQELLKEMMNEGIICSEGLHPYKKYKVKNEG